MEMIKLDNLNIKISLTCIAAGVGGLESSAVAEGVGGFVVLSIACGYSFNFSVAQDSIVNHHLR